MSKILIVSDIHIDDYAQRNPTARYRLCQSRQVAQNIIEAGRREGAEYIAIAGDLLEKSVIRAYIQTEVKQFLDTVMSHFKGGWIIWGNHDLDTRADDHGFGDSVLSVMLPANLVYADKKEWTIDGKRIGFYNFRYGEFDLSWINGELDLLITHATIDYSGGSEFQGKCSVLDESKFKLAICGDIHRPAQIGKYVSIGIPQKCKMGDSDDATGVIYDTRSGLWYHVDLDPGRTLMKFSYTTNKDLEGWDEASGTWQVYKADTSGLSGKTTGSVNVPAWSEVNQLLEGLIGEAGLSGIHSQVVSSCTDIDRESVDFGFTLLYMKAENWRSIKSVFATFTASDRILVKGHNGAGKTSLLSAIRYAFTGNNSFKDFVQHGEKDCWIEVGFIYQGNTYSLRRGSGRTVGKDYGLWMNGELVDYSGKAQFTADIPERFPFIQYLHHFFLDDSHNKFLGGMTEEEKAGMVSKFFGLDKIDALHETARAIYARSEGDTKAWKRDLALKKTELGVIESGMSQLSLPTQSLPDLEQARVQGLAMEKAARDWTSYIQTSAAFNARLEQTRADYQTALATYSGLSPLEIIRSEEQQLLARLRTAQDRILALRTIDTQYAQVKAEMDRVMSEGTKLKASLDSLGTQGTCSHCGQVLADQTAFENHKASIQARLSEVRIQYSEIKERLTDLGIQKTGSEAELRELQAEVDQINLSDLPGIQTELRNRTDLENRLNGLTETLISLEEKAKSIEAPPEVHLPPGFSENMEALTTGINAWRDWIKLSETKAAIEKVIQDLTDLISSGGKVLDDIGRYIEMTSGTGLVYEEIMKRLVSQFSDNTVRYEVSRYKTSLRGGGTQEHLDLVPYFQKPGREVSYQAASSGQQTMMDVHFMSKIVSGLGILVLDEFLKQLSPQWHEVCIEMISGMNIGCIMLCSHMEGLTEFNNKTCTLSLDGSGYTQIEFT